MGCDSTLLTADSRFFRPPNSCQNLKLEWDATGTIILRHCCSEHFVVSCILRPQPLAIKFTWDVLCQGIPTYRLTRAFQFICYILGAQFKYTVLAYNQFAVQK